MANESVVSFKRGQKASLDSVNKVPGQILFSLNEDNTGSIYYDENGTTRYRMSWDLKDTTNKFTISSAAITTTSNRVYPVGIDKDGYLAVNIPWVNTTYNNATTSEHGLMSAADKQKLDGIASGAKTGTVTSVATGTGLTGGTITTSGTIKVKLVSETALTADSSAASQTSNRIYSIVPDKSGNLAVVVPWVNTTYNAATQSAAGLMSAADKQKLDGIAAGAKTGTVTSVATGAGLTGGTITTSGTLKANLKSETKLTNDSTAGTESSNRVYPVALDKSGYLAVVVPWSNTTYTAGAGLQLSSNQFSIKNDGVTNVMLVNDSIDIANNTVALGESVSSKEIGSSPFIIGTQAAATGTWTGNAPFDTLEDGQQITYWLPFAGSGNATLTLTFPDSTTSNAVPCYYGGTSRLTTHYGAGSTIRLTYRKNITIGSTTIAEGWWADANYDSNSNDTAGYIRNFQNAAYMKPTTALYRYLLLFSKGDGEHLVPANTTSNSAANTKTTITTESFNIFEPIYYYSTTSTVAAEGNLDGRYYWQMRSDVNLNFSFNINSTLTTSKDVYLVVTLDSPVTGKLRNPGLTGADAAVGGNGCISQTLPTTNDGYYYIKLGHAYSTSSIILTLDHPIYYHDGTNLRVYTALGSIPKLTTGRTIQTKLDSTSAATFDGSANITPGVTGILGVANGGTGRNTLTSGSVLIGNGTGQVGFRSIRNNTSTGALGWTSASTDTTLITTNTLAYWNGAYSGTSSNISVVGTITTGTWSASTIAVNKGGTGKTSWTAGEVVYASAATTLAGTGAGTSGQFLKSGGSNAPTWASLSADDIPNISAAKITSGTLPIARGGTGTSSFNQWGVVYANTTTTLTDTGAGTSGYLLQAKGSAAPAWVAQSSITAGLASALTNIGSGDAASSTTTQRYVWFSYDNNTTGRPAYSSALTFQTSTGTLTATKFSGNGASITNLNMGNAATGTLATQRGGTGNNDAYNQWGVVYASTTTKLVNTVAGTSGQILKSNGSSAPTWVDQSSIAAGSFSSNATVTLTGDATGTSAGSTKSWSVPVTLANSGVTAGSYGPTGSVTPSFGQTFSVPKFTVDAKGRVTAASTVTVTVPQYSAGVGLTLSSTTFKAKLKTETAFTADSASQTNNANRQYMVGVDKSGYLSVNIPWTDTNTQVTQTGNNENKEFPILLKYTNNATDETNTVKFNKTANMQTTINPSTGTISAKDFKVQSSVLIEYNSTTETLNFVFS